MLDRYDQDLLLDYLEDELDADRRAQLDAMLAEDPQLAALLSEMANDRAVLRSLPQAQAPADLVNDVTKSLERRMLLDGPVEDLGPIPMSRGRAADVPTTRSISWGRVVGLTGLAASVALVAGIIVITFNDPLERTANELAASTPGESEEVAADAVTEIESPAIESRPEGIARGTAAESDAAKPAAEAIAAVDPDVADDLSPALDDGLASRSIPGVEGLGNTNPRTPTSPLAGLTTDRTAAQPIEPNSVGTTAAISAIQPRQQLVLFSESPEVSLEQLFEFCVDNGIAVVQPDQARLGVSQFNLSANEIEKPEADAADEVASFDSYALLINENQLDTLVLSLNNSVALDPKRAGKASLISNQAAVLTDLPEGDNRYSANQLTKLKQAGDAVAEKSLDNNAYRDLNSQQAIQLRKPDLGSRYANTRNDYNLQLQANYGQRESQTADLAEANLAAGGAELQAPARENAPKEAARERSADQATKGQDQADGFAALEKKDVQGVPFQADQHIGEGAKEARRIDATRGNWLSAHLPVADTAPLLLQWRDEEVQQAPRLVPVTIQRAPTDQVNTLRQRQQDEYASRRRADDAKSEAKPDAATAPAEADTSEAEPATTPEPAKPAEPER